MPFPDPSDPVHKEMIRFLKYVAAQAAINSDVRARLVGPPAKMEGDPPKLTGTAPNKAEQKKELARLFQELQKQTDSTKPHDDIWQDIVKQGNFWKAYSMAQVEFFQLRGGNYILDNSEKYRVLIAPMQKAPITYFVGVGGTASTPHNPTKLTGCDDD